MTSVDFRKTASALLVLAHGSTECPDSSRPTREIVARIGETGCFRSVFAAFWKEEPSFRQILSSIEQTEIYVVPNFISEGYFTKNIVPRELKLEGRSTEKRGKIFHYCDPVGTHPSMTDLIIGQASTFATPPKATSLIIVGHGTTMNKQSKAIVRRQVEIIKQHNSFAEVCAAYMDERPFVSDWRELTSAKNVIVVPFFISDGPHTNRDIPEMLGIQSGPFQATPHLMANRNLFYSRAIGTSPLMSSMVLDQVLLFDEHYKE